MPKEISLKQFLQIFKDQENNKLSTNKYCFLLGAGASVSSDIPSGNTLAKKWFDEIKNILEDDELKKWKDEKKIDENNLASSYSSIYEKRFEVNKSEGYFEIQKNLEGKEPSIGYAYLAKILSESNNKFVITTNFDSLIEDSLFLYTNSKPLVCGHESLASYLDTHTNRPTIIKIHRDVLLEPFSEEGKITDLEKQWKEALKPIVSNFNLVVVGYAGNDGSLMNYLSDIKDRKNIYWCKRASSNITNKKINNLLSKNDFIVNIEGFDLLMIEIKSALKIKNIETKDILELAKERIKNFEEQEKEFGEILSKNKTNISKAVKDTLPSWFDKYLEIEAEKDLEKKDLLYKETLKEEKYKKLNHNYAIFLQTKRKDYDNAEIYYKKALDLEPDNANYNGNYALVLNDIRKDYDTAEIYYKKALDLEPNHANNNGNYAVFLNDIRKDYDNAEIYYKKALDLEPDNANYNGNYAVFLKNIRKDYDTAEIYYKKALDLEPNHANNNGNYASLLFIINRDEEAIKYLEKSFKYNKLEKRNELELELNFYILAHINEKYEEAKENIEKLLKEGYKSIGWDFSKNIEKARKDNHPHVEELEKYEKLITEE